MGRESSRVWADGSANAVEQRKSRLQLSRSPARDCRFGRKGLGERGIIKRGVRRTKGVYTLPAFQKFAKLLIFCNKSRG
jgi:hypothetical protein